ncbi:alternative oxidase, mitochondrial-like [Pomacea canaliculata]|uniref:alternative oxidase, mitochondrial-like n=1 Tax=Pomacea canaliculata TaxID=400727 RepID=UPI000D73749A|nr:alternative oxidase, mitochondrial-like [Pomacea canaliculata]
MFLVRPLTGRASIRPQYSSRILWQNSASKVFKFTVTGPTKANAPTKIVQSSHRRTLATKDTREEVMPKYKGGDFKVTPDPSHIDHFKTKKERKEESERSSPCRTSMNESPPAACKTFDREPACDNSEAECVTVTHRQPHGMLDKVALSAARGLNQAIVYIANYNKHIKTNEQIWLSRITIYEALNAVPPSVAASVHHVTSILLMRFDYGAIHGLIEEAKDEQMHLFAALQAKKASIFLRLSVLLMQGVFIPIYTVFYVICPKMCHRFTAYLDEESVAAYTECLREIKDGQLAEWRCAPAPPCAKKYWKLSPSATMRDFILVIRADEARHRKVNHSLASMRKKRDRSPSRDGCEEQDN